MADQGSLIPVSDEQAKVLQEAIKALRDVGGFLRDILGTFPEDLVGYFGGDWLKVRRSENAAHIIEKAKARLEERKRTPERPSISVLMPLLIAAADEERDELQEIWARLLAAAADPARAGSFRARFIEVARELDPLDAVVLKAAEQKGGPVTGGTSDEMVQELKVRNDEIQISLENLSRLDLMNEIGGHYLVAHFGREFLRAISD